MNMSPGRCPPVAAGWSSGDGLQERIAARSTTTYLDGRGLYLQIAPKGGRSWLLRYSREDCRTREETR